MLLFRGSAGSKPQNPLQRQLESPVPVSETVKTRRPYAAARLRATLECACCSDFDVIGNENESDAMLDRVSNAIANSHTILLESEQTLRNNHELR